MKVFMKSALAALAIVALASFGAFATGKDKIKKETVTFASDTMVNGTLLKAGTYELRFDETTGELAILKGGKVKAKAPAHFEPRSDKAPATALRTVTNGSVVKLASVTFGGSRQDIVLGGSAMSGSQR